MAGKQTKQEREAMETRLGTEMAEDLTWRFPERDGQIRAAAWLLSHVTFEDAKKAAFLAELSLKWVRTQMGGLTLAPLEWPDRVIALDSGECYEFDPKKDNRRGRLLKVEPLPPKRG